MYLSRTSRAGQGRAGGGGVGGMSDRAGEVEEGGALVCGLAQAVAGGWWLVVLLLRWGTSGEEQITFGKKCSTTRRMRV